MKCAMQKVKKVKESGLTGDAKAEALKAAENAKDAALYRSHFAFPANLSLFLDEKQIEACEGRHDLWSGESDLRFAS